MKRNLAIAAVLLICGWCYAVSVASIVPDDYYQFWNPGRALVEHRNPYGMDVARDTYLALSGKTLQAATEHATGAFNDQRFVYPLPALLPVLPLNLLPFRIADVTAFTILGCILVLCPGWLRRKWDRVTLMYSMLVLGSYPALIALLMRQPTILFFGFAVGSLGLLMRDQPVLAGIAAGAAVWKPQITLPVLLPILVWAVAAWRSRLRFVVVFTATALSMLGVSFALMPSWVLEWFGMLQGYVKYTHPSIVIAVLGSNLGSIASIALIGVTVVLLWLRRGDDLWAQAALSTSLLFLTIQSEAYNIPLLIIPAVWIAEHHHRKSLLFTLFRSSLIALWVATVAAAALLRFGRMTSVTAVELTTILSFPVVVSIAACMCGQHRNFVGSLFRGH